MDDKSKQCKQTLGDGTRCGAWSLTGKDVCFSHDVNSVEAKKIACTKGGLNKTTGINEPLEAVNLRSPDDILTLLSMVINEVRAGKIDLRTANCLGFLTGHLIRAFEIAETNKRLEAIEAVFNDLPTRRGKNNGM